MEAVSIIKKKEIVSFLLDKDIIVSKDFIESLDISTNLDLLYGLVSSMKDDMLFLNKDIHELLQLSPDIELNFKDFEKAASIYERSNNSKLYDNFLSYAKKNIKEHNKLLPSSEDIMRIVVSHDLESRKRTVQDFVSYFTARYEAIEKILRERTELANIISIGRLQNKAGMEAVSIIGIVKEKQVTKNGNYMLKLEDKTGEINVLVNKTKPEMIDIVKDIVLDEVIGILGVTGDKIVFANNILQPDIPLTNEFKKSQRPGYALFLSDLHVGSTYFLEKDFNKFLSWLNCDSGNDSQQQIAKNVKYIFIAGDLVDGVGIYPGQEEELVIKDVMRQYEECASLLKKIPSNIRIIVCPGNHDAVRISEPQPVLYDDYAKPLYDMPNISIVSNPSYINIHSSAGFSGFNVLMYHGYSFDHYIANVDTIRNNGGYDRADLVMKFLLKRRHLAPTHSSTLYIPNSGFDPLVIDKIPDFFVTGHIHKTAVANYRNITLVSGSCWQAKTAFQEKVGHNPEPSRVPIVDLQTRKMKILKFSDEE